MVGNSHATLYEEIQQRQRKLIEFQYRSRIVGTKSLPRRPLDRPLPDFLIIGAAKAGTTSLFDTLQSHPEIAFTEIKEPDFFSVDEMYAQGLEWYRSLFQGDCTSQLIGEASTSYSRLPMHDKTVCRVYAANPAARIIYMTRDPVVRTYSHMLHRWTRELFPEDLFRCDPCHYLDADPVPITSSLYKRQLEPWIAAFGEEQVLVVSFERLVAQTHSEVERVFAFLGLHSRGIGDMKKANGTEDVLARLQLDRLTRGAKCTLLRKCIGASLPRSWRQALYSRWALPLMKRSQWLHRDIPPLDARLREEILKRLNSGSRYFTLCRDRENTGFGI